MARPGSSNPFAGDPNCFSGRTVNFPRRQHGGGIGTGVQGVEENLFRSDQHAQEQQRDQSNRASLCSGQSCDVLSSPSVIDQVFKHESHETRRTQRRDWGRRTCF